MCGLWGFVSTGGPPDPGTLERAALAAANRGPDAWGYVSLSVTGLTGANFRSARLTALPAELCGADPKNQPAALIGHCRLATSGGPGVIQPLLIGGTGLAVAHNGNYYGHRELAALHGFPLATACDSEVLGFMAARLGGALRDPAAAVVNALSAAARPSKAAVLVLDTAEGLLAAVPAGQPLYSLLAAAGVYFASQNPGGWFPLARPTNFPIPKVQVPDEQ